MQASNNTTKIILVFSLLLSVLGNIATREELTLGSVRTAFETRDQYTLPPPILISTITLNYNTFAASMTWIAGLIYFGDWRMSPHTRAPKYLMDYASTIQELDPSYFRIYDWLDAVYLNSRLETKTVDHPSIMELHAFLRGGEKYFPNRYELPYKAGLNSLGYSTKHTREERLESMTAGIESLKRCIKLRGCPPVIGITLSTMQDRISRMENNDTESRKSRLDESEFLTYSSLYLQNSDPEIDTLLSRMLRDSDPSRFSLLERQKQQYAEESQKGITYLPTHINALLNSQ